MAIIHRVADAADLESLSAMLDNEFIFGKGRKTSFAQRFPSTFCTANAPNIFLASEGGNIISVFLSKRFDWRHAGRIWRGAMIGAVYSDPKRRGEGIAGGLLTWGTQALRNSGAEFAVLWTAQPGFYEKLGWTSADIGMLGNSGIGAGGDVLANTSANMSADSIAVVPLAMINERELNDAREQYLDAYVRRQPLDYFQQPLPAQGVDALLCMEDGETTSYALLGQADGTGILYEMVGSEDGFAALWETVRRRHRAVIINDRAGSSSHVWLSQHTDIVWESKKLAMWLPLSPQLDMAEISGWYIPYFDRI